MNNKIWPHQLWGSCALLIAFATTGCSIKPLDSVAAALAISTQSERAQERAELQALAEKSATAEKAPVLETPEAYVQVIAQLQSKQLWFASLAHLDVLEQRWPPTERSQLLRADALRQMGEIESSRQIYERLRQGAHAAKALHGLGLLAAQENRFSEAVDYLTSARTQLPTDPLLLSDLGYALLHTQQAQDARIPLMQAAQLQPSNARIAGNVALYLVLFGAPESASAWMQQQQLTEAQRAQVFVQAQKLAATHATVAQAAPESPKLSAEITRAELSEGDAVGRPNVAASMRLPVPHASQPVALAPAVAVPAVPVVTARAPSMWMTETPRPGVRP